jgi:signal peptidase I
MNNKKIYLISLISICLTVIAFKSKFEIYINPTNSLEEDIFLAYKNNSNISKNDFIIFNYHGKEYGSYNKNTKLVKIATCMPGEILETKVIEYQDTIFYKYSCNNKFIGTGYNYDSKGNDIPNFVFNGKIPDNKVFAMATHKKSFDSRYYGLVDIANVQKAKAIL